MINDGSLVNWVSLMPFALVTVPHSISSAGIFRRMPAMDHLKLRSTQEHPARHCMRILDVMEDLECSMIVEYVVKKHINTGTNTPTPVHRHPVSSPIL